MHLVQPDRPGLQTQADALDLLKIAAPDRGAQPHSVLLARATTSCSSDHRSSRIGPNGSWATSREFSGGLSTIVTGTNQPFAAGSIVPPRANGVAVGDTVVKVLGDLVVLGFVLDRAPAESAGRCHRWR